MKNKRVVITGIGPISSIGIGKKAFWNGLKEGKSCIHQKEIFLDDELWESYRCHSLSGFDIKSFGIDPDKLRKIKDWKDGEEDTDLNYFLAAIKLAMDDAGIVNSKKYKIGAVLAHENIGLMPFAFKISNLTYEKYKNKAKKVLSKKDFIKELYQKFVKVGYDVQAFPNLFHVTQAFDIKDYSLFVNNACASGLYAIESARQIIMNDQCDIVIAAAADHSDVYKYIWFNEMGIYSKRKEITPFHKDADGFIIGDGAVGMVLEEYEHACKRGATIYAEYAGGGFDLEGWKITVPEIGSQSYQNAMRKAFDNCKINKEEIDLVCAHGVGKVPIDYYEAKAITDTFGKYSKPLLTAFKAYLGHTLGASALLEAAIVLLMMKNKEIIASKNCENPDKRYEVKFAIETIKNKTLQTAMKICCPFGGFNSAVIFRGMN